MPKALLFLNGTPPLWITSKNDYDLCICADGAYHYTHQYRIKIDYIIGDMDSFSHTNPKEKLPPLITIADQNTTDMEKCLQFLLEKGIKEVLIYGASGGSEDHFLGNLYVARKYYTQLRITFHTDKGKYFFIQKTFHKKNIKGHLLSLFPFPTAQGITTKGLAYPLHNETLSLTDRIGTRNYALEDEVHIRVNSGDLLVLIYDTIYSKEIYYFCLLFLYLTF